jgi:hypothetical protein
MFLRQEYLHVPKQLILVFPGESGEDREIVRQDVTPRFRRGSSAESGATAGFEEV